MPPCLLHGKYFYYWLAPETHSLITILNINLKKITLYLNPPQKPFRVFLTIAAGFISHQFVLTNGTRQGCPLSPLIFDLTMEILAQKIRQARLIEGIRVAEMEHKIVFYADYVIIMTTLQTAIPHLLQIVKDFDAISYYKINADKTQAMSIGLSSPVVKELQHQYTFDWRTDYLNYLGVKLTKIIHTLYKYNHCTLATALSREILPYKITHVSWLG